MFCSPLQKRFQISTLRINTDAKRMAQAIIYGLAEVAQLVEQLIRNEKVGGSIPLFGTKFKKGLSVKASPFFYHDGTFMQIMLNSNHPRHDRVPRTLADLQYFVGK